MKTDFKRSKKFKITLRIICSFLAFAVIVLAFLGTGMAYAHTWEPWVPDYEKVDISSIINKKNLTDDDYELLFRQTGLTKLGIDGLIADYRSNAILSIQDDYFGNYQLKNDTFGPFVCWEHYENHIRLATLENGDILLSASTHFSWFRFGHAALVVDGAAGLTLNAVGYGSGSDIENINDFNCRPAFLILRPKKDKAFREEVVKYALDNLLDVHYQFSVGVLSKKYPEKIRKTQCSHIVWYAYKKFGLDLDANGGAIVTPQDLANSKDLELVQVYGFDPDTLWSY